MRIPPIINAGDSVSWLDAAFSTPGTGAPVDSSGYSLSYALRGPVTTGGIDVAATPSGTGWAMALSPAQTAALNTGVAALTWSWQATVTKSGLRLTAGTGTLRVRPNLAALSASTTFDGRSQAEQILAAVEAEVFARINGGATLEYTIGSRSLKKEPITALMDLRAKYRLIVSREKRAQGLANGLGNPGRIGVRFSR